MAQIEKPIQNSTPIGASNQDDPILYSFAQNVARVESWLKEAEATLAHNKPDTKKLRLFSMDIVGVLDEATKQSRECDDASLISRYHDFIPRLEAYIVRSERVFKAEIAEKIVDASNSIDNVDMAGVDRVDNPVPVTQDASMTDLTRPEIDARFKESEAKLAANKAEVDARLANFDTSVKTGFAELRAEMAKQSGDMRVEMANMRSEMHKGTTELLKWGAGIAFAAVASTVGLLTYINKATDKSVDQAGQTGAAKTQSNTALGPSAPAPAPLPPATQSK